jgi:hypothetical protein
MIINKQEYNYLVDTINERSVELDGNFVADNLRMLGVMNRFYFDQNRVDVNVGQVFDYIAEEMGGIYGEAYACSVDEVLAMLDDEVKVESAA